MHAPAAANNRAMLFGAAVGAFAGWELLQRTANGDLARFLVDDRAAWAYVGAIALILMLAAVVLPRLVEGLAATAGAAAVAGAFTRSHPGGRFVFVGPFLTLSAVALLAFLVAMSRRGTLLPSRARIPRN